MNFSEILFSRIFSKQKLCSSYFELGFEMVKKIPFVIRFLPKKLLVNDFSKMLIRLLRHDCSHEQFVYSVGKSSLDWHETANGFEYSKRRVRKGAVMIPTGFNATDNKNDNQTLSPTDFCYESIVVDDPNVHAVFAYKNFCYKLTFSHWITGFASDLPGILPMQGAGNWHQTS